MPAARRGEQRAKALPAESVGPALGDAHEVDGGQFRQILAAGERAEHKLDGGAPFAEIVRQRLLARHVAFARSVDDRTGGAHLRGEEILQLALARVAQPDAHLLARRRRIDFDAAARRELGERIDVGRMDPMRAEVERNAESARIRDAAAADMIGRLDHHEVPVRCGDAAGSGDPGRAGPDDDDVGLRARGAGAPIAGAPQTRPRPQRRQGTSGGSVAAWFRCALRPRRRLPELRTAANLTVEFWQRDGPLCSPGGDRYLCVPVEEHMLDDAVKAIAQMFSPPLRAVLWKSIGLALALIVVVAIVLERLIVWLVGAGSTSVGDRAWAARALPVDAIAWLLSIAAGLGIVVGSVMLMPAVTALVASFFADQIAEEVERENYPADPPGMALPLWRAVLEGGKTALLAIVVYVCAAPFLLFAGLGAVIFFLATAWLLGREYFELAAMRFRLAGGSEGAAQAQCRDGLCRRPADRRLCVDPDRQPGDAAVRHGVHGARAQTAQRAEVDSQTDRYGQLSPPLPIARRRIFAAPCGARRWPPRK